MNRPTEQEINADIATAEAVAWEVPGLPADTPHRPVKTFGIIGAATMGGGEWAAMMGAWRL
jgi:3-hydroxyacyl-CoA dehydrogenase